MCVSPRRENVKLNRQFLPNYAIRLCQRGSIDYDSPLITWLHILGLDSGRDGGGGGGGGVPC